MLACSRKAGGGVMRCEALTKKNLQCSFSARITIPNIKDGGPQDNNVNEPYKYGRSVHICAKHWKKLPIKLIENGILQHFNKYNYGNIVLDTILEWGEGELPMNIYDMPDFWKEVDK
jgi:hypothetical protein